MHLQNLALHLDRKSGDLSELETGLSNLGVESKTALNIVRKLAGSITELNDSITDLKLSFAVTHDGLNCGIEFYVPCLTIDPGTKIKDVALSVRTCNILRTMGIETVGELANTDAAKLRANKNFSKITMTEIENFLSSVGGKLRD